MFDFLAYAKPFNSRKIAMKRQPKLICIFLLQDDDRGREGGGFDS